MNESQRKQLQAMVRQAKPPAPTLAKPQAPAKPLTEQLSALTGTAPWQAPKAQPQAPEKGKGKGKKGASNESK